MLAGVAAAAVVGFASGIALGAVGTWLLDDGLDATVVTVGLGGAALADLVHHRTGRLRPWAVGQQVPQEWSRMFPAPTVALLYGARLGVAPLTILSTWQWWAVTVLAGLAGPWPATLVAAWFGLVRALSTLGASLLSERSGHDHHQRWFGRLRARRRIGDTAIAFAAGAAIIWAWL